MFKFVAILGYGDLGQPVVDALLNASITPILLTRQTAAPKQNLHDSVKLVPVDYTNKAALTAVFREHNIEVVISCLGETALDLQPDVAEAAKEGGVQLFFPSEFGFPTMHHTDGFLGHKNEISQRVGQFVPTVRIHTGFFHEWVPFLTVTSRHPGKVSLLRGTTGDVKVSFTALPDIGGFIAYILTHLSLSELAGSVYRLQGESFTLNEVARLYGKEVVFVDETEFSQPIVPMLQGFIEKGWTSTGHNAANDEETEEDKARLAGESNKVWKGHVFKTLKEALPSF